ncbi:MAG: 2-oxo acid dehydrogenase subunit E2, partial [Planctomycetes bacterium]|nr:2-oxo acid dehydrogenase subunit E2 [Planctomycetota bacterium]
GEAGEDISELLEQAAKEPKAQTAVAQRALEEEADIEVLAPERLVTATIKVTEKRRMIAERLSESKYLAPHYYLKISVLVDGLLNERKMFNKSSEQKLSFNSYMMKICAETMKKHPRVNATWQGDTIGMRDQVDIALAVAQPDGLITPVVRDCGSKGIVVIDKELKVLIDKTRKGVLTPPEYTNSTFTITNLGGFGIDEFTAIINPPNSAILAMGAALKQPVVGDDGGIEVRTVMKLTLSCDHRLIDGVVGAMFLSDLKYRIEYPIEGWY